MEKICIVKRRKIGSRVDPVFGMDLCSRIEASSRIETASRIETVSRIETISRIEAVSRIHDISPVAPESQGPSQVLTLELTPEQMERLRANSRFQHLYGTSPAPIFLNVHLESASSVRMLKTDHVCEMLQVSKSTVARLVRNGSLRIHRIGRLRRFSIEDVMGFLSTEMRVASFKRVPGRNALAGSQAK